MTPDEAAEVKWLMALQAVLTARAIADAYQTDPDHVRKIHRGQKWAEVIPKAPEQLRVTERMQQTLDRIVIDREAVSSKSISASQVLKKRIAIPPHVSTNSWMQLTAGSGVSTLTPCDSPQHSS